MQKISGKMTLRQQYLDNIVKIISNFTNCESVGIRMLRDDGGIPYQSSVGFSRKFWESENCLSINKDNCACIRVITGKPKPPDSQLMSRFGSFYCNNTQQLMAKLSEKEKFDFRGVCIEHGFLSVAVIPLRNKDKIIGVIHLADKRQEQIPLKVVEVLESLTAVFCDAIGKFDAEDQIRKNYHAQNIVNSLLTMSLESVSLEDLLPRALEMILSVPGFDFEPKGSIFLVEDEPNVLVLKAQKGFSEALKSKCTRVVFGKCLCGKAALNRKLLFASNIDCEHGVTYKDILSHGHYCMPIVFGANKALGVINICLKEGAIRNQATKIFLRTVANSLAVIIQRKQIEQELYRVNKLLNTVLSNTHFLIAYMDINFNFICVNRAYAQAHKKDPGFFIGRNYFDLYPDESKKSIFQRISETGEAYYAYAQPFEFAGNPAEGASYYDWSLRPVKDNFRKIEGMLLCLVNVTEAKWTQNDLIKAQKELIESKRLSDIGILAATIAHELRNPLGVIRTAAYNLKRKAQNPLLESHFLNIEKKILESDQIINNLLFYSRIKIPQYAAASIYEIMEECVNNAKKRYKKCAVKLHKRYKGIKNNRFEIDQLQIKEVFNNILNNAYEALPNNKGQIEIEADYDEKNEQIKIFFKDNGVGIDEEDLKKMPQSFFTRKSKGTGLGLPVSYQIVNLHGGRIDIESARGKGTKFTIILPAKQKKI